jgi:hypothetical protein
MTLDKHIFYNYIHSLSQPKKEKKMSEILPRRNAYITECRNNFKEVQKDNKVLIHYIRNRKGQRRGVILAAKPEGSDHPLMGWSLCNMKRDNFNKYIGITKALDRLQHGNPMIDNETFFIPVTIEDELERFSERVERYFKVTPVPIPVTTNSTTTDAAAPFTYTSIEP